MIVYKLVTQDLKSASGDMDWEIGRTNRVERKLILCKWGIHIYLDPWVAVFMNPTHARIQNPRLLECSTRCKLRGDGLKFVVRSVTPQREIPVPVMTREHRIATAILCVMERLPKERFPKWYCWAEKWLSGEDRSPDIAYYMVDADAATAVACIKPFDLRAKIEEARKYLKENV